VCALIEEVTDRDHGKWKGGKKTMSSVGTIKTLVYSDTGFPLQLGVCG
jgi:hypothetical protein